METDFLLGFGGEVKALSDDRIGGYLVKFSSAKDPDLDGDYFTPDTDFDLERSNKTSIYYEHGLDGTLKARNLGKGVMVKDEVGVWVEAQLNVRDHYEKAIMELAKAGKLGWSSGTASHLVERKNIGAAREVLRWPLGLDASLTPRPAEPRTIAVAMKSYQAVELDMSSMTTVPSPAKAAGVPAAYFQTTKAALESRLSLDEHASRVESAAEDLIACAKLVTDMIEDFTDRCSIRSQVRAKASRQLSQSNRDRVAACMEQVKAVQYQMETLHASLDALLIMNDREAEPEVTTLSEGERLAMEAELLRSYASEWGIS